MRILVTVLTLVLAAAAFANPFTLAYQDAGGASRAFSTILYVKRIMKTPASSGKPTTVMMVEKFTTTENVKAAQAGKADIAVSLADGKALLMQKGVRPHTVSLPAVNLTYSRTPEGKLSGVTLEGENAGVLGEINKMMDGFDISRITTGAQFPVKSVYIGQHWKTGATVEFMHGVKADAQVYNWLTSIKTVNGKTYLQIDRYMRVDLPKTAMPDAAAQKSSMVSGRLYSASYLLFDPATGEIDQVTSKGTIDMTMAPADGAPQTSPTRTHIRYYGVTKKK